MGVVETNGDTNDGAEELADQHAEGSVEQDGASAPLLNGVERDGGRADVDEGEDQEIKKVFEMAPVD